MNPTKLLLLALVLSACGDGKADAARKLEELQAADQAVPGVDLRSFDMPLVVALPNAPGPEGDTLFGRPQWVEEFGHVRIRAGDHFALTIAEDEGDLARLKADLERDMLRTYQILEESGERLVYRQHFPDEDLVFVHFYLIMHVGDRRFVVESAGEGRFNEADIARMSSAVQPAFDL